MKISFQLFEKENFLIQKFTGIFSIEEYTCYNRFIMSRYTSDAVKKVLNDFRELDISDPNAKSPGDFSNILEKITSIRRDINNVALKNFDITLVFWVDKPLPTVIAHLFVKGFDDKSYFYCSTVKNIMSNLQLPPHFRNLETIVANLENTFNPS